MDKCAGCDSTIEDLYYVFDWPGFCTDCLGAAKRIKENMANMVRTNADLVALVRLERGK